MIHNIFGYIASLVMVVGGGAAYWYGNLSNDQRAKVDAMAAQFAMDIFSKTVAQLSNVEAKHVLEMTRQHFAA